MRDRRIKVEAMFQQTSVALAFGPVSFAVYMLTHS
jgi:hypothetical protein